MILANQNGEIFLMNNNYQLLNEAEYDMKNYADRGECYPQRPKAPYNIKSMVYYSHRGI